MPKSVQSRISFLARWIARLSSLFSLSRHKWPSAIALLAMLMLFIAPVISKSLEHQRVTEISSHAHHHVVMDMGSMEMPASTYLMPGMGASVMDDIACGYCQLLLHIPLIIWLFIPFIWLQWQISRAPPPPIIPPLLAQHIDAKAQPRAPPVKPSR